MFVCWFFFFFWGGGGGGGGGGGACTRPQIDNDISIHTVKHGSKSTTVSDGAPDFDIADLFRTAICSSRYVCTMSIVSNFDKSIRCETTANACVENICILCVCAMCV